MTWPLENDTSAITKKIAKNDIDKNRVKKVFSLTTIVFATALLMMLIMFESGYETTKDRMAEGQPQVVFYDLSQQQIELLYSEENIESMEAFCLLQLQRPSEVIDILEPVNMQPGSPEPLLASAYRAIGNDQEAKKILQVGIYKEIMTLFNLFPSYLNLCLNDAEQFAETCQRFYKIADVFQMKMLHPGILLGIYITIAQDWMKLNNAEQALDILSQYTELAVSNIYPLHLHGDDFFDLLDEWLDSELVLRSFPPRDETLIRHSMTQALNENPVFLPLAKDSRFQMMVNRLKASEEEK